MFLPFGTSFTSRALWILPTKAHQLLEHSDACSYFEKWHRYRSFLFFLLNGKPLIESLHGHIYEISSNTDDDLSVLGMRLDGNSTRKSSPHFCVVNHLVYRHTQSSLITANSEAIQACHQRVYVTQGTNLAWRSRVEIDQVMAGLPVVVGLEWCSSLKAWIWSIQLGDGELSLTDWHTCRITNKSKCAEVDVALNLYPMTSTIWWKPNIWSGLKIAPSAAQSCYLMSNSGFWRLRKRKEKRL